MKRKKIMNTARVIVTHTYGEVYPNTWDDYDWLHNNNQQLLETYGVCAVAVYQRQIVGMGATMQDAIADAEKNLHPDIERITPIVDFVRPPHRLHRAIFTHTVLHEETS
jgi:hypothetical protein